MNIKIEKQDVTHSQLVELYFFLNSLCCQNYKDYEEKIVFRNDNIIEQKEIKKFLKKNDILYKDYDYHEEDEDEEDEEDYEEDEDEDEEEEEIEYLKTENEILKRKNKVLTELNVNRKEEFKKMLESIEKSCDITTMLNKIRKFKNQI